MSKWLVSIPLYASVSVEVEAESEAEAIDFANRDCDEGVCFQCSCHIDIGGRRDGEETAEIIDWRAKGEQQ